MPSLRLRTGVAAAAGAASIQITIRPVLLRAGVAGTIAREARVSIMTKLRLVELQGYFHPFSEVEVSPPYSVY